MPCIASPEGLRREVLRPREAKRVQCIRQVHSMPAARSALLCSVRPFKARWLNRGGCPRYPHAISGALRASCEGKHELFGLKTGKTLDSGDFGLGRRFVASGGQGALHRAWLTVGERLHREFQREVEGRVARQRGLLYVADGAVQADLKPGQAAQISGLPAAGACDPHACRPCSAACRTNITGGTNIGGRSPSLCAQACTRGDKSIVRTTQPVERGRPRLSRTERRK